MNWFRKLFPTSIQDLDLSQLPLTELKKRTRIAAIDDDENSLPIDDLRKDGFSIDTFTSIDSQLLGRLSNGDFDIIILDIKGVVPTNVIANDGLGILQYLKKQNPNQIIIACSSKKFDPSQHKFFNLANDVLDKPITYIDCKERLEQIIQNTMNIEKIWQQFAKYLSTQEWSDKQIKKLEKDMVRSLKNGKTSASTILLKHLDKHANAYELILHIVDMIIKLGHG